MTEDQRRTQEKHRRSQQERDAERQRAFMAAVQTQEQAEEPQNEQQITPGAVAMRQAQQPLSERQDGRHEVPEEGAAGAAEYSITKPAIGADELKRANEILRRYKAGKANLEKRLIENEQYWKLRHWAYIDHPDKEKREDPIKPRSAWLFNTIMSKHADGIEAYPEPNILPREAGDQKEAETLSAIIPVIMEQNDFEETYSAQLWQKLKGGTGVYSCYWDSSKLNGLGDISIQKADILSLFWEPGITDIQSSPNFFHVELQDTERLKEQYPQLEDAVNDSVGTMVAEYIYDDSVSTEGKSLVVDWYYKKQQGRKTVLHYCKYVGTTVLYATENDTEQPYNERVNPADPTKTLRVLTGKASIAERGWYDHGLYPFVFDTLFPVEGSPCGFGYIDVCKSPQDQIDMLNQAVTKNALILATPRYFVRNEGGINAETFADFSIPFVPCNQNLGEDSIRRIENAPLPEIVLAVMNNKIEEMKHTSGNQDIANGSTTAGITAASAIAALQETAGKSSRDSTKSAYRAYRRLINIVIELIRQFYDAPRKFRIVGHDGAVNYQVFDNHEMQPVQIGQEYGVDMGYRLPVFDIEVIPQKQTAYTKMSQNELALQLYGQGFFNPQLTDQALMCLDMMDFGHKQELMQKIQQNGTMMQKMQLYQQLALTYAQMVDPQRAAMLAQQIQQDGGQPLITGNIGGMTMPNADSEHARVQAAREASRNSSQPEG